MNDDLDAALDQVLGAGNVVAPPTAKPVVSFSGSAVPRPGSFGEGMAPAGAVPKRQAVDPLDAAIDSMAADQRVNLNVNVRDAVRYSPEEAADARRLAARNGVPEDVALRNLKEVKDADYIKKVTDALEQSPALRRQFLDTGFVRLAHDDTDNLTMMETMVNSFRRAWPALKGVMPGVQMANSAAGLNQYNAIQARLDAGESILSIPRDEFPIGDGPLSGDTEEQALARFRANKAQATPVLQSKMGEAIADTVQFGRERAAIPGAAVTGKVMGAKTWSAALGEFGNAPIKFIADIGPESLGQNLPAMAAALLSSFGGPQNPMIIMGANSFVTDYSSQITQVLGAKGVDTSNPEALRAALTNPEILADVLDQAAKHAAVVGGVDALSMGIAGKLTMGSKALASRPLTRELANIALQMPIQGALGGAGEAGGQLLAGQEIQPGEIIAEVAGEFFGAPGEVVSAGAGRMYKASQERQARLQAAAEQAQSLDGMMNLAAESKVRERDPQAFAKSVQDMAEAHEDAPKALHIDARLLGESLQQSGMTPDQIAQALPSVAGQLEEARAIGGDVVIPIGEAMAAVPGSTLEQTFREHARTTPDGLSATELKEADAQTKEFLQRNIETEQQVIQQSEVLRTGRDEVMATLLQQMTAANRQTAPVNQTNALLAANYFAVMAERMGITPQEFYARYPLRVTADAPAGVAFGENPRTFNQSTLAPAVSQVLDRTGQAFNVSVSQQTFGVDQTKPNSVLVELRDPVTGDRRGFVDFSLREDGVLTSENTKVAPDFRKRGLAEAMYKAARDAGYDIAPGMVQTDDGLKMVEGLQKKGLINKEAAGPRFRAGNLDLQPLEGGSLNQDRPHPFANVTREQFLGNPKITSDANAKDLAPSAIQSLGSAVSEPFANAWYPNLTARYNESGSAVYDGGKVIASYDFGDTLVVDKKYRRAGIGAELVYQWRMRNPDAKTAATRTKKSQALQEKVWSRVERERGQNDALSQGARGKFTPTALTISLLQSADLSTFVHELGHFFLEVQADLASQPGAPVQIAEDMAKIMAWFGVKDVATWKGMSLEEQRPYHEKFAESFEQYMFEGKAPAAELQPVFSTVRAWMTSVYKTLAKFLAGRDLQLNDEVRGVFDRMLASDQAIADAQALREYFPLFTDAATAGMTPAEWMAYQQRDNEAIAAAQEELQTRSLRDMQWLTGARNRALKKLQQEAKAKRAAVEAEVTTEVDATPIEQARRKIKELRVSTPESREAVKVWEARRFEELSRLEAEVKAEYLAQPEAQALVGIEKGQYLAKKKREMANEVDRRLLAWEDANEKPTTPIPPLQMDVIAEQFGFSSGAELTAKLASEPKRAVAIEAATDLRMLETYGDTATPEGIERAANEAVSNEARGRFVASEFRAAQRIGKSEQEVNGKKRLSTAPLINAAKQFAATLIARQKVRDVKPAQHEASEVRAAKAARAAMAASDMRALEVATRDRMLQFYAAREANAALTEIEKKLDYLKKFDKESIRKGLPPEYVDQIDQLLERFDLRRSTSNTEIDRRKSLNEWIAEQQANGIDPVLPELVLRNAKMVSYKELTVEEFRGLVDSVKQVEHFGRLKNKLLTSKDQRDFEAVRDALASTVLANGRGRTADTRTPTTGWGKALRGIKNFGAAHIKAAAWGRIFDGGKDGGLFWEYLIRPANAAGDFETTMRAQASEKLQAIMAPAVKGQKMNKGQFFPTVNRSFTKQERLAVALNMGNEGNMQRLLGGEGWTFDQIVPVLESLTAADWSAVQGAWDHLETYKPLIAAKERRISGVEPDWIEAKALTVQTSDGQTVNLRGGYYPVKYDPSASIRAEQNADAEGARQQLQGAYSAATTRRSFTKARTDEVVGRPLLYDLTGLYAGVNEVIHDLAWHEWLIDANRLLRDKKVDGAIRSTYGPSAARQLKTWRESIAEGDGAAQAAIDGALGMLRRSVSVAGLGFNVMSAAMQPLGMTQTIVRIGPQWAAKGIKHYLANPVRAMREANQMSQFMAGRQKTQFRDMNELRNRVTGNTSALTVAQSYSFWLMMRIQQMVDVPTWHGAYEKAVAAGNDDARAIALADQAVIDAQGSGMNKDQSAIEGGGPAQKLFTVFYSFMNTALNLGVVQGMTASSKAKFAADMLMLYSVPAVLGAALKMALTPGDLDDEDIVKRLAASQVGYLLGMVVLGRDTQSLATGMLGLDKHFQDYKGPAGLRVFTDLYQIGKQTSQGEFDDAFRKAAVNSMGSLFGLPAAQINRTWTGAEALGEGETDNPLAILFGFEKPR